MKKNDSWAEFTTAWVTIPLIFVFFLTANIIMGVLVGAFLGWIFSLTFLGTWINEGLISAHIQSIELYKVGAALGFISGFFKYRVSKTSN
jgi:hypothetical protein